MASASVFHLLINPPVVNPPGPNTLMSAGSAPDFGNYEPLLLDPATPVVGAAQAVRAIPWSILAVAGATRNFLFGRWVTRPLPGQTIGAGNWSLSLAGRFVDTPGSGNSLNTSTWGFTLAQWRPSTTAIIARAVDSQSGGTAPGANLLINSDRAWTTTIAGSSLTITTGDALVLEVWGQMVTTGGGTTNGSGTHSLLFGGFGQWANGTVTVNTLTDTDAVLIAPAPVVYL